MVCRIIFEHCILSIIAPFLGSFMLVLFLHIG